MDKEPKVVSHYIIALLYTSQAPSLMQESLPLALCSAQLFLITKSPSFRSMFDPFHAYTLVLTDSSCSLFTISRCRNIPMLAHIDRDPLTLESFLGIVNLYTSSICYHARVFVSNLALIMKQKIRNGITDIDPKIPLPK